MKTTTILNAHEKAEFYALRNHGAMPEGFRYRKTRQWNTFHAALLARIEAGDRAREALVQLKNINTMKGIIEQLMAKLEDKL